MKHNRQRENSIAEKAIKGSKDVKEEVFVVVVVGIE